ncbi:flagellar hook-basal body protein [Candidatus Latescibacterota bacterium]
MIRGIYTAVGGMVPRMNQVRNVADNLANQTTHGYKKNSLFLRQLITAQYALDHANGVERTEVPEEYRIDFSQGGLDKTDRTFDIALNGPGFFRVMDNLGNTVYTRNGRFYLDQNGQLINSTGMILLDINNNPVNISGINTEIMANGEIFEDGAIRGRIGIAEFNQNDYQTLNYLGRGLFANPAVVNEIAPDPLTEMYQGYLEESNVNPVLAMVDMMEIFRNFELGQKSIQILDQTLQRVVTEVGVVR